MTHGQSHPHPLLMVWSSNPEATSWASGFLISQLPNDTDLVGRFWDGVLGVTSEGPTWSFPFQAPPKKTYNHQFIMLDSLLLKIV